LLRSEVSWLSTTETASLVGTQQTLRVYEVDANSRIIRGSIRRLEKDPWPALAKRFPKGTKLTGKVVKTTPQFVHVDIGDGIIAGVPKGRMITAGYEYASYEQSVVPGQGLDVVIDEVRLGDRIIKLDLQRNIVQSSESKRKSR
jgi:small subunit ribosomal protein S1